MQEPSLKKRYSIKLLANILSGIISAVIVAIVPKALGPIVYGQFVFLQNFFIQAIGFLDMGSSIAFFTKLSARQDKKELITFYFLFTLVVLVLISLFVFGLEYFGKTQYVLPDIPNEYIFMGLFFGFLTWFTQIFIKISDAYALTVSVELTKIVHKVLMLLLLLYFIHYTDFSLASYFSYQYISLFSFLFVLSFLFVKKDILSGVFRFDFSVLKISKEFIDYSSPLLVYSVIGLMAGMFDIWLLQKVSGSEQTGFYGLAYSLAAMCFLFTSAMTPLITREFSKSYEQKDLEQMRRLFFRYIPMLYSIATFFGVFISMQSDNVLDIFTDEKFKDAYLVLVIMAFYPIHQTYGQLSSSIFYATGKTKLIRNISLFTAPLGMFISFTFIYLLDLGAVGLAYKMIIGQVIGVNIGLYFNAKFLNFKMKYFLLHQVYTVLFFVVFGYLSSMAITISSPLLSFLLSGMLYTVFVIIFTYIFPQVFATTREEIKLHSTRFFRVIKK